MKSFPRVTKQTIDSIQLGDMRDTFLREQPELVTYCVEAANAGALSDLPGVSKQKQQASLFAAGMAFCYEALKRQLEKGE